MSGRSQSSRAAISEGLLFNANSCGRSPEISPASKAFGSCRSSKSAASTDGTGKQRRPAATAVNFHATKLFQPDIAEGYFASEIVQQRKLANFVGRLEHHRIQAERLRKAIGISAMEVSLIVKKSHFFCALPGFHDQLQRSRIEPPPPLLDQLRYAVLGKRSGMLLTQLELNIQASFARHLDHIGGF